jgi:hypothetical protein
MSKLKLEVNSEIMKKLRENKINIQDGISFLLCLYYSIKPSYIPTNLEKKVLCSGIVSKEYGSGTIDWVVPLFNESIVNFEWIKGWMDLFKNVNPERRGVKADVLKRMKDFFMNNPTVTVKDVQEATKLYLSTVSEPKFCKKSHKFIKEQDGHSMLLDFVTQYKERQEFESHYKNDVL